MIADANTLMERESGGVLVELVYDHLHGLYVQVTEGEESPHRGLVPPDRGMDAFAHPYCYIGVASQSLCVDWREERAAA